MVLEKLFHVSIIFIIISSQRQKTRERVNEGKQIKETVAGDYISTFSITISSETIKIFLYLQFHGSVPCVGRICYLCPVVKMNWDQPQLFARNILRSPISQSPRSISPYRRNRFTAESIGNLAISVCKRESATNGPADN